MDNRTEEEKEITRQKISYTTSLWFKTSTEEQLKQRSQKNFRVTNRNTKK